MAEPLYSETEIIALDGKIFAMLNDRESACLNFYRRQGRKYGIKILILNNTCLDEIRLATSEQQADEILKLGNSKISVVKDSH